ncbi:hypothetical protein BDU57DRAFT_242413 [Ampelomyces quisqualis]|uniref:J domain-containing protein n=1 Tax=Ampelomyces quisqualis TaxID=50730 RepID=A0A6A5QLT2_AMPQU|nr:hypothetical protein BDU57DRAFT_242413 [Ampelomyces quisqualis]
MLSYSPFSPPNSPMCKIGTSPFRSTAHQRHGDEQTTPRPRPISITSPPPTMQHMKRSSIYVSDASILLSHKNPILSPMSPANSTSSTDTSLFIDHYASLELAPNASIDDVRFAFRRLRGQYFTTDAVKYRAAQAAFDVLANPAARQDYDSLYRARPAPGTTETLSEPNPEAKHARTDSAHGDDAMPALPELDEEETRTADGNWGLKRHRRLYEPVLGTQPYMSYIPILELYDGRQRHPVLGSRRPVYVGTAAIHSRPT